jgi:uncharacterized protein (DUF885 family)
MLNRRAMLLSTGAAAAAVGLAPRALAAGDPALASLFDQFFQEGLQLRPESATQLGLDKGANAGLKAKLNDGSTAGGPLRGPRPATSSAVCRPSTATA